MITCPRCAHALPFWLLRNQRINSICPQCQSSLDVYSFPAIYRPPEKVDTAQLTLADGEACCYEHSSRKAAAVCSHCGRFVCALCEVQLGGQTLCPECLHGRKAASAAGTLESQRTKYDSIALALAIWPLLIFYFTVITAPLALGMAIYAWRKPTSIVRHNRWRVFTAAGLASLEIVAIAAMIITLVYASR